MNEEVSALLSQYHMWNVI